MTDADEDRSVELVTELMRRITMSLDLRQTLQVVAEAVVERLGFGAVVVNLVRPDDTCEAAAVAGPESVREVMLGTSAPMAVFREILGRCEPWGALRFFDHRKDDGVVDSIASWVPPDLPDVVEDGFWHPDDILLAPLHAGDELIGVLSVDMPAGGRMPDLRSRRLLEQFAAHAALAIEHARVHTLVVRSEQLFRAMFDRSPIAVALTTEADVVLRANGAFGRLLGEPVDTLVGRRIPALDGDGTVEPYEVHLTRPDGCEAWGRVSRTRLPAETDGVPPVVLLQVEDVTQLRVVQLRFAHAATHDDLTGLPNRVLVLQRLSQALALGEEVAVLFCDVDHFKTVNDRWGHAAGDRLLVGIAGRLARSVREVDVVGRFGGDEFVVVARSVSAVPELAALAERLRAATGEPLDLGPVQVRPSLSVGGAVASPGATTADVLSAADGALYTAKQAGRGRSHIA